MSSNQPLPEHIGDVERWLSALGYTFTRKTGSHRQYTHARTGHLLTLSVHNRRVDREQMDNTVKAIRRMERGERR